MVCNSPNTSWATPLDLMSKNIVEFDFPTAISDGFSNGKFQKEIEKESRLAIPSE